MAPPVVTLDDARATDTALVGGKAARLARARAGGLPVLPGVVVTAPTSRPAISAGVAALGDRGSGAARLAVMRTDVEAELLDVLRTHVDGFASTAIVRSSSADEGGTSWSGAFSSFDDVTVDELSTAVRGVWASAFTVHALERFEVTATDPAAFALAVLVQPQLRPDCGGTARCGPDGIVRVNVTTGPLADLVGGWDAGQTAVVTPAGVVRGEAAEALVGSAALRDAAALARRVRADLGDDVIEWAHVDGRVVLLQAVRSHGPSPVSRGTVHVDPVLAERPFARLARAAGLFAGALGEALVLPWAAATDLPLVAAATPTATPADDLVRAAELSRQLTSRAWQRRGATAAGGVDQVLRRVLEGQTDHALDALRALRPVDPDGAAEVVTLLAGVGAALADRGWLRAPDDVWRCPARDLADAIVAGRPVSPPRPGPGRWEPFVHAAVVAAPRCTVPGTPVVEGVGAGRLVAVTDPHHPPPVGSRQVLVARQPLPALASLLWSAAGLVTEAGNPGAHLFEVAHSLGVPALAGVDLASAGLDLAGIASGAAQVAAVDGAAGVLALA